MRPYALAALAALALSHASPARAHDVPQPVSRTVLLPPAECDPPADASAAVPASMPPPMEPPPTFGSVPAVTAAPVVAPRSEIGFQLRMGAADRDRLLLGTSIAGSGGFVTVGFSADAIVDVSGTARHFEDGGAQWWGNWCVERADGRCLSRADLAVSGFAGLRHTTDPVLGGARMRLELVGELGWQWTGVNERVAGPGGAVWSDANRAFTFGGIRGGLGLTVSRHATLGFGAYGRQGLGEKACLATAGGCTWIGGRTTGVYVFAGGDWGGGG